MRHGKGTRVRSAGGDEKAASFCAKKPKESFCETRDHAGAKSTNERGEAGARGELLADRRVARLVGGAPSPCADGDDDDDDDGIMALASGDEDYVLVRLERVREAQAREAAGGV